MAWRAPVLWRAGQVAARTLVAGLARLRVTGEVPAHLRRGPLILAANHISPFDPVVLTAACRSRGIAPRFLAMAELFTTPLVGPVMRHWGHIPVHRRSARVTEALTAAADALAAGSVVVVYPEGGIGLDPGMWPERGRTGAARLALTTGAPVVPVALWGAHEVVPYAFPRGSLRALPRTLVRRPLVRVRFGPPVDLSDLQPGPPSQPLPTQPLPTQPSASQPLPRQARRATDRIMAAITRELVGLRADEPDRPRHVDPTRPIRS